MLKLCNWLEEYGDCELYTISQVCEIMKNMSESEVYNLQTLKKKLQERYREHIFFTELQGRTDVICFREMASFIICKMRKKKKQDKAAAQIIKAELRELDKPNTNYPTTEDVNNIDTNKNWVPTSLQILLRFLIPSELKQVSIGQCIVQAARPRYIICPILFGLGVQLEKSFGSKWLVNNLNKLGFSISSDEVSRFKHSSVDASAVANNDLEHQNNFVQWVADNVDHNLVTITGRGTFHGMGVISASAMANIKMLTIKRLTVRKKAADFAKDKGIPIHYYY